MKKECSSHKPSSNDCRECRDDIQIEIKKQKSEEEKSEEDEEILEPETQPTQ